MIKVYIYIDTYYICLEISVSFTVLISLPTSLPLSLPLPYLSCRPPRAARRGGNDHIHLRGSQYDLSPVLHCRPQQVHVCAYRMRILQNVF